MLFRSVLFRARGNVLRDYVRVHDRGCARNNTHNRDHGDDARDFRFRGCVFRVHNVRDAHVCVRGTHIPVLILSVHCVHFLCFRVPFYFPFSKICSIPHSIICFT